MLHTAHINENRIQIVGEHCRNTAELSSYFAKDFLAENIGYLQGLLHDMGKLTQRFDDYINNPKGHGRSSLCPFVPYIL